MSIGNSPEDDRPPIEDDGAIDRPRTSAGPDRRRTDGRRGQFHHAGAHPHRARDRAGRLLALRRRRRTPADTSVRSPRPSDLDPDAAGRAVRRRSRRPSRAHPRGPAVRGGSGSGPSRAGPTGPPPWSPRSSWSSASSASPMFGGGDKSKGGTSVAEGPAQQKLPTASRPAPPRPSPRPPSRPRPVRQRHRRGSGRQGHRQGHRDRRQELDLGQGPQRQDALRRPARKKARPRRSRTASRST